MNYKRFIPLSEYDITFVISFMNGDAKHLLSVQYKDT